MLSPNRYRAEVGITVGPVKADFNLVVEISKEEPCPECCGGLEPVGDPEAPRYYRCNSCGLDFRPVKKAEDTER